MGAWVKKRVLFDPASSEPFAISRTKIEMFQKCQRCFYLDRRLGVSQPTSFPLNLNTAVDTLLKKEFDAYRAKGAPHPLMTQSGIQAVPFAHPQMDEWRENFVGVRVHHVPTNFMVFGAVDDIWVRKVAVGGDADGGPQLSLLAPQTEDEIMVVDYKATSKQGEVGIDADWQIAYKRQMEFYQWLLRGQGLRVSDTGYFVYCNGDTDKPEFGARLDFEIKIIPYTGDDAWVEPALVAAKECLVGDVVPPPAPACEYCAYREKARAVGC